jgi:hypothetical protein
MFTLKSEPAYAFLTFNFPLDFPGGLNSKPTRAGSRPGINNKQKVNNINNGVCTK